MSGYGVLGQERLRILLLRTAHLPEAQRLDLAQWADRALIDYGILENILDGYVEVTGVEDGHPSVRMTDAGRAALRETDELRNVRGEG